jgi:hypothetical protein
MLFWNLLEYELCTEGGWTSHKAVDISDSIANLLTQTQLTLTRRASQHDNQQHTALSGQLALICITNTITTIHTTNTAATDVKALLVLQLHNA